MFENWKNSRKWWNVAPVGRVRILPVGERLMGLETRARSLIGEIVPLMKDIPKADLSDIHVFLKGAIQDAKISLASTRAETERRMRPAAGLQA